MATTGTAIRYFRISVCIFGAVGTCLEGAQAHANLVQEGLATVQAAPNNNANLDQLLAGAAPKLGKHDNRTKELSQNIADAHKRLRQMAIDRRLTQEEKQSLIKSLAAGKGQKITIGSSSSGCSDCGLYANDFYDCFSAAGWNAKRESFTNLNPALHGIIIAVHDPAAIPEATTLIMSTFTTSGITDVRVNVWGHLSSNNDIAIIIMPKT
jgi:hypothetical protein